MKYDSGSLVSDCDNWTTEIDNRIDKMKQDFESSIYIQENRSGNNTSVNEGKKRFKMLVKK